MTRPVIISLFEYTGTMLRPWADAGYTCFAYDLQHEGTSFEPSTVHPAGGIWFMQWDADDQSQWEYLIDVHSHDDVQMVFSFPPCTDLAVSGAAHWAKKREANPNFQRLAADRAVNTVSFARFLGAPFMIENPVGALVHHLGKSNHSFHPYEYGGYIGSDEAAHPLWPDYIANYDAYPKKTLLWVGNGFTMPVKLPVACPVGYSTQHLKLGGKSEKTKNIRSATPRGFARAVFEANQNKALPVTLGRLFHAMAE